MISQTINGLKPIVYTMVLGSTMFLSSMMIPNLAPTHFPELKRFSGYLDLWYTIQFIRCFVTMVILKSICHSLKAILKGFFIIDLIVVIAYLTRNELASYPLHIVAIQGVWIAGSGVTGTAVVNFFKSSGHFTSRKGVSTQIAGLKINPVAQGPS